MKNFIKTIQNIFSIEELRQKILYTIFFIIIFRVGSFIVLPGVDPDQLKGATSGVFGMINQILGGSFSRASIFALGIMPYITASIVIQLASLAVPYFQRLRKEGESGNRKINQITRVLTILITMAQASGYIASQIPANAIVAESTFLFSVSSVIILTSGTIFCMWLGERITDKGIGNGISMLIMIGIISGLPLALIEEWNAGSELTFLIELIVLFFVIMGTVLLTTAVRRIPIQYASQVAASGGTRKRLTGGAKNQRSYLPIKVNAANVMPIIFAQSLMFVPPLVAGYFAQESSFAAGVQSTFNDFESFGYNVTFALMIIVFTFFYTAIVINPTEMSDHLKRNNAFIPGVKPGEATSKYISQVVDHITLPGAVFLAIVAILPAFASLAGVGRNFAQFFGGTSLIIMVGVILDTLQQIEGYLLSKHYDGMLKTGKLKGRASMDPVGA